MIIRQGAGEKSSRRLVRRSRSAAVQSRLYEKQIVARLSSAPRPRRRVYVESNRSDTFRAGGRHYCEIIDAGARSRRNRRDCDHRNARRVDRITHRARVVGRSGLYGRMDHFHPWRNAAALDLQNGSGKKIGKKGAPCIRNKRWNIISYAISHMAYEIRRESLNEEIPISLLLIYNLMPTCGRRAIPLQSVYMGDYKDK